MKCGERRAGEEEAGVEEVVVRLVCYCVVMINVSRIELFILTDESSSC